MPVVSVSGRLSGRDRDTQPGIDFLQVHVNNLPALSRGKDDWTCFTFHLATIDKLTTSREIQMLQVWVHLVQVCHSFLFRRFYFFIFINQCCGYGYSWETVESIEHPHPPPWIKRMKSQEGEKRRWKIRTNQINTSRKVNQKCKRLKDIINIH